MLKLHLAFFSVFLTFATIGNNVVVGQSGPSFKCKKNQGTTENMICDNRRLSALDGEMAGLYFELKELLTNDSQRELLADQRDWIKLRNSCLRDAGCYFSTYYDRIDFFNGILNESRLEYVNPEPEPVQPTVIMQPTLGSQQTQQPEVLSVSSYPAAGMSLGANLRAGPGTKNAQVGKVVNGEPLIILDKTDVIGGGYAWYYVMGSNGAKGYIWGGLLCNFYDPEDGKGCNS